MSRQDDSDEATLRRTFSVQAEELRYLYDKLLFWLYERDENKKAKPFASRLEELLNGIPDAEECILGNECRALIAETAEDWEAVCRYRQEEIRLVLKLRAMAPTEKPIARAAILRDFTLEDLADRYTMLAIGHRHAGRAREAVEFLDISERLCREHGVEFDGADVRSEILEENPDLKPVLSIK